MFCAKSRTLFDKNSVAPVWIFSMGIEIQQGWAFKGVAAKMVWGGSPDREPWQKGSKISPTDQRKITIVNGMFFDFENYWKIHMYAFIRGRGRGARSLLIFFEKWRNFKGNLQILKNFLNYDRTFYFQQIIWIGIKMPFYTIIFMKSKKLIINSAKLLALTQKSIKSWIFEKSLDLHKKISGKS